MPKKNHQIFYKFSFPHLSAIVWLVGLWFTGCPSQAQTYELRKTNDSLYWLNDWRLPYPIYQFQTGDINGDGEVDAMVGVVKTTRYYQEKGRRLFIFKQVNGKVRPLWLGSKLGGILEDFRYKDGKNPRPGIDHRLTLCGIGLQVEFVRHEVRPLYHKRCRQRNSNKIL